MKFIQILIIEETDENNNNDILLIEGRSFELNNGLSINGYNIPINECNIGREQGTGLNTWDGAVVLAKYLELNSIHKLFIENKYVLELGAGTGTAGIASLLLGSSLVVLTDLPYTLDNLRFNQQQAQNLIHQSFSSDSLIIPQSYVLPLDWSDPSTYIYPKDIQSNYPNEWDIILGADIVWLDHLIPSLIFALKTLASPNTIVFLSHQTRSYHTDELFFTQLHKYFDVKMIPKNELNPAFSSHKINIYQCQLLSNDYSSQIVDSNTITLENIVS